MHGLFLLSGLFIAAVLIVVTMLWLGPHPKASSPASRPDLDLAKDPHALEDVTCKPGSKPPYAPLRIVDAVPETVSDDEPPRAA
jgi:hypothetical protein